MRFAIGRHHDEQLKTVVRLDDDLPRFALVRDLHNPAALHDIRAITLRVLEHFPKVDLAEPPVSDDLPGFKIAAIGASSEHPNDRR